MDNRPLPDITTPRERLAKGGGKNESPYLEKGVCATCGESTHYAMHWDCRRDQQGRLLIVSPVSLRQR